MTKQIAATQEFINTLKESVASIQESVSQQEGRPPVWIVEVQNLPMSFTKVQKRSGVEFTDPKMCHITKADIFTSKAAAETIGSACYNGNKVTGVAVNYLEALKSDLADTQAMITQYEAFLANLTK